MAHRRRTTAAGVAVNVRPGRCAPAASSWRVT
jgi:hypothetical protein